jgi:uncharacterized damage-inducible protein DinB
MDPRVALFAETLRLNHRLFRNCLEGFSEEQLRLRPAGACNNAAFVAAHLVDSRCWMLAQLGSGGPSPLARYTEGKRGIDDMTEFPSLAELEQAWEAASAAVANCLDTLSAAQLDEPVDLGVLAETHTTLGLIAFVVQHDSYHLGQLSLLRRQAGLPAMSYA